MIIILGIILLVASSYMIASGKDWEQGQRNADRRTRQIISAIGGASSEITSCYQNIMREQKDYFTRFCEDTEKELTFQDDHGRWFRKRLIYSPEGEVIAEEIIGVER